MDVKKHVKVVRRSVGLNEGAFYAQFPHADQFEPKGDDDPEPAIVPGDASEAVDIHQLMKGRPFVKRPDPKPLPDED